MDKKHSNKIRRIIFFLKFLEIRLRFVLILVITALVVGYWDNIQNYYERWQRNRAAVEMGHDHAAHAEGEYEFFCPMHPFVVRDRPGKCPICGMDLVKRKKGAEQTLPTGTLARVQVSPERIMQAGVRIEPVSYRLLTRTVRTYGVIEPDETRMARIVARFPGRIDKLMVNAVGMTVKKGEPLAQIYSPKYLAATQEYVQALRAERGAGGADETRRAKQLADYARQRLILAGFTEEQVDAISANSGQQKNVTLYSPLAGTVLEKNALLGDQVTEESTLYTIADLSTVWIQALTLEADISAVRKEMPVEVTSVTYPGEIFYGTVDFIYPTVSAENRSVKVRVVVDNKNGKLKPGMYVSAVMRSPIGEYGEVTGEMAGMKMPERGAKPNIKLPTMTQADADAYLASLAPGAAYYVCAMHPEVVSDKPGDCPKCGMHLGKKEKAADGHAGESERWAEGYSCEMHPDELSPEPGVCKVCNCGMPLKKMRVERVLSISEKAVIDTGTRMIVYVETSPGVYDSRAVTLGPRAGEYYPVLDGLKLGDRVVAQGSFLIDAEARLNPAPVGSTEAKPSGAGGHQHGGS